MTRAAADHAAEFSDFTEASYRECLRLAKANYRFSTYPAQGAPRTILWRHDLDVSIHRALRLAEIEAEEGVMATYFVYARCPYYNILATEISAKLRRILALGHRLGVHFDPTHAGVSVSMAANVSFNFNSSRRRRCNWRSNRMRCYSARSAARTTTPCHANTALKKRFWACAKSAIFLRICVPRLYFPSSLMRQP